MKIVYGDLPLEIFGKSSCRRAFLRRTCHLCCPVRITLGAIKPLLYPDGWRKRPTLSREKPSPIIITTTSWHNPYIHAFWFDEGRDPVYSPHAITIQHILGARNILAFWWPSHYVSLSWPSERDQNLFCRKYLYFSRGANKRYLSYLGVYLALQWYLSPGES